MDKTNPNISKSIKYKDEYSSIQYSRVSWRRKSRYRKLIKRRFNKSLRSGDKILIKLLYND